MKKNPAYLVGTEIVDSSYHFDVFLLAHDLGHHVLLFLFENHLGHLSESHLTDNHYLIDSNWVLDVDTLQCGVWYRHTYTLS